MGLILSFVLGYRRHKTKAKTTQSNNIKVPTTCVSQPDDLWVAPSGELYKDYKQKEEMTTFDPNGRDDDLLSIASQSAYSNSAYSAFSEDHFDSDSAEDGAVLDNERYTRLNRYSAVRYENTDNIKGIKSDNDKHIYLNTGQTHLNIPNFPMTVL